MANRIATIARYTVLEAVRTRLPLLTTVVVVLLYIASLFIRELAIVESGRFQTAFYASTVRFAAVFIVALHVIASVTREFQDKGLDVVLALDLPRGHYIVGKLAGFVVIAAVLALVVSVPLVTLGAWQPLAQWSASLAFELAAIAALSIACVITINQLMPAASVVIAAYVVARSITAMRLIGENPIAGAASDAHQWITGMVEALALVIPALDGWTRTAWLVDQPAAWTSIAAIAGQSALFIAILGAVAAFDMYRKSF
jgi:hypothetical protein